MKMRTGSSYRPFFYGLFWGIVGTTALGYLLHAAGLLMIFRSTDSAAAGMFHWLFTNLGLSLIPFGIVLLVYISQLGKLHRLLGEDNAGPEEVQDAESKVDLLTSLFFGVGVIWTAIGMRNALLAGLGDLNAETAASRGAWFILNQLIDGGILLALSTTIAGGIGGYILRCIKTWFVGPQLHAFYENLAERPHDEVVGELQRIGRLLKTGPLTGNKGQFR